MLCHFGWDAQSDSSERALWSDHSAFINTKTLAQRKLMWFRLRYVTNLMKTVFVCWFMKRPNRWDCASPLWKSVNNRFCVSANSLYPGDCGAALYLESWSEMQPEKYLFVFFLLDGTGACFCASCIANTGGSGSLEARGREGTACNQVQTTFSSSVRESDEQQFCRVCHARTKWNIDWQFHGRLVQQLPREWPRWLFHALQTGLMMLICFSTYRRVCLRLFGCRPDNTHSLNRHLNERDPFSSSGAGVKFGTRLKNCLSRTSKTVQPQDLNPGLKSLLTFHER